MKKIIYSLITFLCVTCLSAQVPYYGAPFYKEGFDQETITDWVQEGTVYAADGTTSSNSAWVTSSTYTSPAMNFKNADPNSTHSLYTSIEIGNGLVSTITSPEITNTESTVCFGFSIFKAEDAFPDGFGSIACLLSNDNAATWDTVWVSGGVTKYDAVISPVSQITFTGWSNVQINLPDEYNNKNLRVRFAVNSPVLRVKKATVFIDGVFLSKRRAIDATILSVDDFKVSPTVNINAYFNQRLNVVFRNSGSASINTMSFGFMNRQSPLVEEQYTFSPAVASGETKTFTFNSEAILSALRATDTLKVWVKLEGDDYAKDDTLVFITRNTLTDVPYAPEWLTISGNPTDEWSYVQSGSTASYPYWSVTKYNRKSSFVCDASKKFYDSDTYLFSCPMYLKKGKTYEVRFDLFTDVSVSNDKNAAEVYFSTIADTSVRTGDKLLSVKDIDGEKYRKSSFRFTVEKDTSYYVVFRALCAAANAPMYLSDFLVKEVAADDAEASVLLSPVDKQYTYTNAETVKVRVMNAGLNPIDANQLKVYCQIGSGREISGTVDQTLAPGATYDYTFTEKVDLSAYGTQEIKVWVDLSGDKKQDNDSLKLEVNSLLTELPYDASLGTSASPTYEEDYWSWTAKTSTWKVSLMVSEGRFQYGGTANVPAGDVVDLYSRPLHISAGKTCQLTYLAGVSAAAVDIPLVVGLYKKDGSKFISVKELLNENVKVEVRNAYNAYSVEFTVPETGDYYIVFTVRPETGLTCNVFVKDIKVDYKSGSNIEGVESQMMQVYPNPASDYIAFTEGVSGDVSIYSISGQLMYNKFISAGERVDVSSLAKGAYVVRIKNESGVYSLRCIIK